MIRHILDTLPDLSGQPVIICGKGESFDRDEVKKEKYFKVSVNETLHTQAIPHDLTVFNDWTVAPRFTLFYSLRYATPFGAHAHMMQYLTVETLGEVGQVFEQIVPRLSFYDIHHYRHFPDHPAIESYRSTAEAALHIVALKGARDITFTGIGDPCYSTAFGGTKANFEGSLPHYRRMVKQFGLDLKGIKL